MSRSAANPRRRRTGNAVLEFALVFGLLWMLVAGAFRAGYSIYLYESLLNAVAGAARYAARVDFDEPNHTFVTAVRNMAVYGSPTVAGSTLAPGLTPGHIAVTWTYDPKGVPLTITVAVTGYAADVVFQTFTWSGKPSITVRYAGSYKS
jgi:Flp pilus assembly protein TadG